MPTLNAQGDLRRRLSEALAPTEVRVRVPDRRPERLVTVTREGGSRRNALLDGPGIGIYCWAPTEQEAWELADAVADEMAPCRFRRDMQTPNRRPCTATPTPTRARRAGT